MLLFTPCLSLRPLSPLLISGSFFWSFFCRFHPWLLCSLNGSSRSNSPSLGEPLEERSPAQVKDLAYNPVLLFFFLSIIFLASLPPSVPAFSPFLLSLLLSFLAPLVSCFLPSLLRSSFHSFLSLQAAFMIRYALCRSGDCPFKGRLWGFLVPKKDTEGRKDHLVIAPSMAGSEIFWPHKGQGRKKGPDILKQPRAAAVTTVLSA